MGVRVAEKRTKKYSGTVYNHNDTKNLKLSLVDLSYFVKSSYTEGKNVLHFPH